VAEGNWILTDQLMLNTLFKEGPEHIASVAPQQVGPRARSNLWGGRRNGGIPAAPPATWFAVPTFVCPCIISCIWTIATCCCCCPLAQGSRVIWLWNHTVRVAPLPGLLLATGHAAFVQHLHQRYSTVRARAGWGL
jgi:hypothetical protein